MVQREAAATLTDAIPFVQISDTHFRAALSADAVPPAPQQARVLARIAALPTPPRFCLLADDPVQGGDVADHARLRQALAPLGVPLLACCGNGDDRAAFRQGFLGKPGTTRDCGFNLCSVRDGARLVTPIMV